MEKKSKVDEVKRDFGNRVADISGKFSLLGDKWKGYSYDTLNGKVEGLMGEATKISDDLDVFFTICGYYEEYQDKVKSYKVWEESYTKNNDILVNHANSSDDLSEVQKAVDEAKENMETLRNEIQDIVNKAKEADGKYRKEAVLDAQGTAAV